MAPLRNHSHCLKFAVTLAFLIFLSTQTQPAESRQEPEERGMTVLGSKPPGCVNKCSNCKPCVATVVVPSHQRKQKTSIHDNDHDDDDSYYLLSWKCKCGNKLYHP